MAASPLTPMTKTEADHDVVSARKVSIPSRMTTLVATMPKACSAGKTAVLNAAAMMGKMVCPLALPPE